MLNAGTSLIARARENRGESWTILVRACTPQIYADCRRFGLPAGDAADVTQEVFLAVYQSLPKMIADNSTGFRHWLRAITRNKVRDFFRGLSAMPYGAGGTRAQRQLQQHEAADGDASQAAPGPASRRLRQALVRIEADFSRQSWRAFWRTAVDGLDAQFVGAELDMTAAAVRKAKSRVIGRLREQIQRLKASESLRQIPDGE